MNANDITAKLGISQVKATTILVTAALVASLAAIVMAFVQIGHMGKIAEALQEVKASIPEKQTPDEFQASLVGALNKLASDRAAKEAQEKMDKYSGAAESEPSGKHIYGALNARFTLVEFSDLECPYCKRFHETPKQLADASNGNVNWQWMHLPLDFHNPAAKAEAHAAECVAEQKGNRAFWAFLDDIFVQSRGNGQGVSDITAMAVALGADEAEFRSCMKEGRFNTKIEEHVQKARQQGISGTPATFVVDNQTGKTQLVSGAQPIQALMAAISKLKAEGDAEASSSGAASTRTASEAKPN